MKTSRRKKLIVAGIIIVALYLIFAVTRYSQYTTYIPFTGRIFDIDAGDLDGVTVRNGTTGESVYFETAEEIESIVCSINALRYKFWTPKAPGSRGGWSYGIKLGSGDEYEWFLFTENWIEAQGVLYYIRGDALRQFVDLVE